MEDSCEFKEQRIYVGNLPQDVKDSHLFSVLPEGYDKSKLEIRHNYDIDKNVTSSYAFVNITGTQEEIRRWCVKASNKSLGGNVLQVQFAKLSFLERLKQEVNSSKRKKDSFGGGNLNKDIGSRSVNPNLIKFDDDHSFDETVCEIPESHEETSNKKLSTNENRKSSKAETMRIESLKQRSFAHDEQQKIIKMCIKKMAKSPSNKVIFRNSDDENEDQPSPQNIDDELSLRGDDKRNLFDDSDGEIDEVINFSEARPKSKLIRTTVSAVDERFRMDSRFFDDKPNDSRKAENTDNEQDNLLKIAESVIDNDPNARVKRKNRKEDEIVIPTRFNPLDKNQSSFIIKKDEDVIIESEAKKKPVKPKPFRVERGRFYDVSDNLKKQFKSNENSGFSLLGLFGNDSDSQKRDLPPNDDVLKQNEVKRQKPNVLKNPLEVLTSNFFNVDDYSDLDEQEPFKPEKPGKITWNEPLFIPLNDPRIEEALKFFCTPMNETVPHAVISRDLKNIVKKKYMRNMNKTKLFKTKLGKRKKSSVIKNKNIKRKKKNDA